MPYKDRNKQREAVKEAVAKHRKGITDEGITDEGITDEGITYPPIVYALVDKEKRAKLQSICESLKAHGCADKVYYGAGVHSIDMGTVEELLTATN